MPTGRRIDTESGAVGGAAGDALGGPVRGGTSRLTTGPGNGPSNPGDATLGVIGETFNQSHHGHLVAAGEVAASSTSTRWGSSCRPGSRGRSRTGRYHLPRTAT